MYLKRLTLDNVRGFHHLDFTFGGGGGNGNGCAGLWVITGDNASGKTSLLKAIAASLVGPPNIHALQPTFRGWIRHGADEASLTSELLIGESDGFQGQGTVPKKQIQAHLKLQWTDKKEVTVVRPGSNSSASRGPWAEWPDGWFTCGYGPFRRLYGTTAGAQRLMSGGGVPARFATLFREDATLEECEIWLKDLHFKALEGRKTEETVLQSVTALLNDEFLHNRMRVHHVDSEGVWLEHPDGSVLPLMDMSDGYRASLAMLVDIIRNMVDEFPNADLVETGTAGSGVRHEGIVLIDELDAHLHPEWQRKVGFWLKKHFPRVQFIVTTHSAFICQAADGLFHLPAPGSDEQPQRIDSKDLQEVVAGTPVEILRGPAFELKHTLSPLAVDNRLEHSRLRSKQLAGHLTKGEEGRMKELSPFLGAKGAGNL